MTKLRNLVLFGIVSLMLLTSCAPAGAPAPSAESADAPQAAGPEGTVVIRNMGNLTSWNPALTSDGASIQARNLLWPPLVNTDDATGAPVPGLQSWDVSEDTLSYTFTIQEDAVWSDGTPITSADVKFMIEAIQSDIETVYESDVEQIVAVNIIDDKSYELVLNEVNCAFLPGLSAIRLLPSHMYAADFSDFESSDFNMNPNVSGGPYVLDEWAPTEFEAFVANPDYWDGAPAIPNLLNMVMEDPTIGIQALQAGEVDYMTMQGDLFQQISNLENLTWSSYPQTSVGFLALNWADPNDPQPAFDDDGNPVEQTPHPLFGDVRVRQAVATGHEYPGHDRHHGAGWRYAAGGRGQPGVRAGPTMKISTPTRTIRKRPLLCWKRQAGLTATATACARRMACRWPSPLRTAPFYRCLRVKP